VSIGVKDLMATSNSERFDARAPRTYRGIFSLIAGPISALIWGCAQGMAGEAEAVFRERALEAYWKAREEYHARTSDAELAWRFGRATFDLAEVAHNRAEREVLAEEGIQACRAAIAQEPEMVAAHYYLALNLGQLARVRLLKGLGLVSEMERVLRRARGLDPDFDHGGPDRGLGLLYRQAPGWPLSVGDKVKGRRHLEQAVKRSPAYPGNRLCLIEALWEDRQRRAFLREVRAFEGILPDARARFSGEAWAWSWHEWEPRWRTIEERAATLTE
jgi:tetratricopeptide (TPR) repeat protein